MIKKLFTFFLSLFIFISYFAHTVTAYDNAVVIINQVRGDEVGDLGKLEYLMQQVKAVEDNHLKANFTIRYDALNFRFSSFLKSLDPETLQLGAFLEVTPSLANDAGVKYTGTKFNWYQAQHSYTEGYSLADRRKILDTYMKKFLVTFGYYPKLVTAWLMDSYSINYLHEQYGVLAQQITREQWGTDSYTLSGGPIHYPYFASTNWSFIPTSQQTGVLVLRQTGADPLYNYGDNTNSFTTQPNDYSIANRGFSYFNDLKKQFFNQQHNSFGFLLLGLENSMDQKYQDEFTKQLVSLKNDGVTTFTATDFFEYFKNKQEIVTGVQGRDLVNQSNLQAFWINAGSYRARLLLKDNKLYLSDLRVFNSSLVDPYNDYQAKQLAFWVTPFIFNASQLYTINSNDQELVVDKLEKKYLTALKQKVLGSIRKKYLPEFQNDNLEMQSSQNDTKTLFDGIELFNQIEKVTGFTRNNDGSLSLSFKTVNDELKTIQFFSDHFQTNFLIKKINLSNPFYSVVREKNSYKITFADLLKLNIDCNNNNCQFGFKEVTNSNFIKLREDFYPYFFPEVKARKLSSKESVFYAHNKYAIADKNPVGLVFIPKDSNGFPVRYEDKVSVQVNPEVKRVITRTPKHNGTTFIDIVSDKIGKYEVKFKLANSFSKETTIYFAPNCKERLVYCVLHPVELKWYLSSMLITKLRGK